MNNKPYALAFDYGTQSVRAIIFDTNGDILGKVKTEFQPAYFSLQPGWAEQHAEFYWKSLCDTSKALREKVGDTVWNNIKTVAVTTYRDGVVCMDENCNVLRPVILWLDQRRLADPVKDIPVGKRALFSLVGMIETVKAQRAATFSNWIAENEPDIWAKTKYYTMFSAYINYRFSGRLVDSRASTIGHFPFNYKKKEWMTEGELTRCIFDARRDQMCELVDPCDVICTISKEVSEQTGIPEGVAYVAAGSDKGCETLSTGCLGSDVGSISLGTSATIQFTTDKYIEPQPFLPAYPSMYPDKYNPEVQIFRGFWMITWFKKEFANREVKDAERLGVIPEALLDKRLGEIPPGSHGLVLQPYWSPGVRNPEAKGAIIGFSDVHTRIHLYRAIIEGIGFGLYDGMRKMEKRVGYNIKRLTVSGGGANSDVICQITADIAGVKVQKIQTYETCALGAAMAAFVGIKAYPSLQDAVKGMSHIAKEYSPNLEHHRIYDEIYNKVYKKIYKANKKFYSEIRSIQKTIDSTGFVEVGDKDFTKDDISDILPLKKD